MTGFALRTMTLTILFAAAAPLQAGPLYGVDILNNQNYPQLQDSWMTVINDHGVAGGYIITSGGSSGPRLPTMYTGAGNFQSIPGAPNGGLLALSNNGVAVGNTYVFQNGILTLLPSNSSAAGVSRGGTVFGSLENSAGRLSSFIQVNGVTTDLNISGLGITNTLPFSFGGNTSLNDAGLLAVFGFNDDFSVFGAFLYHVPTGTLVELKKPAGFPEIGGLQVLGDGRVFGTLFSADFSEQRYGFWSSDGTFLGFFTSPEGLFGVRFNDVGLAVGLLDGIPYIYDGQNWAAAQLPNLNDYTLISIDDFNNRGEFVGLASQPGGGFAWGYVARPIPEPASLAIFAGLLAVGGWAARWKGARA